MDCRRDNGGPWAAVGAPGVDVESTLPGGRYGALTGSSVAAANVSGVAALAAAAAPYARGEELYTAVTGSSSFNPSA